MINLKYVVSYIEIKVSGAKRLDIQQMAIIPAVAKMGNKQKNQPTHENTKTIHIVIICSIQK